MTTRTQTSTPITEEETSLARIVRTQGRVKGWVAERMGVGSVRFSRLLSGEREITLAEAALAAEALGVAVEDLLPAAPAATKEHE